MFDASLPNSQLLKSPEVHPLDISSITKPKNKKSTHDSHRDHHGLTGWTNVNSPNASQIAQETFRHGNLLLLPNRLGEAKMLLEKRKDNTFSPSALQELRQKLWIDVTREKPYEESLRSYPKSVSENIQRFNRTPINRVPSIANMQRGAAEFNVIHVYHADGKSDDVVEVPSPIQMNQSYNRDGMSSHGQVSHSIQSFDVGAMNSKKNVRTLDTNADSITSIKDLMLYKISSGASNNDKRSATALKQRHNEPLPHSRQEEPRRVRTLKLSRGFSYWSHIGSPSQSGVRGEPENFGNSVSELSHGYPSPLGSRIPTKTLNFESMTSETSHYVPLKYCKPAKPKKEIEVKNEGDRNRDGEKLFRMRTMSPANLYTMDWDTSNGFPIRRISRERSMETTSKRRFLETGTSFKTMNRDGESWYQKGGERAESNMSVNGKSNRGMVSVGSVKSVKEVSEGRGEMSKRKGVKNFRLFEVKA